MECTLDKIPEELILLDIDIDDAIMQEVLPEQNREACSTSRLEHNEERRVEKRVPISWSGYCQRLDKTKLSVVSNDVSRSGIGFMSAKPLNVGEKVYVSFVAKAKRDSIVFDAILKIQNVVLSQDLFRCGGRFISLSPAVKRQLSLFMSHGAFNPERYDLN